MLAKMLSDARVAEEGGTRPWRLQARMTELLEAATGMASDLILIEQDSSWDLYPLVPADGSSPLHFGAGQPLIWCPDPDDRPMWLESGVRVSQAGAGELRYENEHIVAAGQFTVAEWRPIRRELLATFPPGPVTLPLRAEDASRLLWGDRDVEHVVIAPALHSIRLAQIDRKQWSPARWATFMTEIHGRLAHMTLEHGESWSTAGSGDCGTLSDRDGTFRIARADALRGRLVAF